MELPGPRRNPGTPYGVLGVSADASQRDIARAYRRAAHRAHPDARPHDPQAAARFQTLTDAYDLLRDPGRRADYDRGNPAGDPPGQPPAAAPPSAPPRRAGAAFLLGVAPTQPIWAGPVQIVPATAPATGRPPRRTAAEHHDPPVALGIRPGQAWSWPW